MDVTKTCTILCLLLAASTAAPLQSETAPLQAAPDSSRPLVRTKRGGDESILRQALSKPGQTGGFPVIQDEAAINKNNETPQDDVIEETEDKMVVEGPGGVKVTDHVQDEEDDKMADGDARGEDDEKVDADVEMQIERLPGNGLVMSEKEDEEDEEVKDEEGSGDADKDEMDVPKGESNDPREFSYYYDYNYPELYRKKRSLKRAIRPMTAENMGSIQTADRPAAKPMRVKRDLTADELRDWLESGASPEQLYYPDYEESEPPVSESDKYYSDYDEIPTEWSNQDIEDMIKIGEETPWGYNAGEPIDERDLRGESTALSPYSESDGTSDRLALLQYLLMDSQPQEEQEEEAYMDGLSPESVRESWEELEAPQVDYEPVVYHGVPGVFIPSTGAAAAAISPPVQKRQLLSMVPGMRRKRGDFYPYSYEPSGGRWGAFIPSEEKRNAQQYDRLMRMAAALNGGRSQWDGEWEPESEWRRK